MKKRLLSMFTLICLLASMVGPIPATAAATNAYFTGDYNYPTDQAVGGWKNLYGEIYSAAGFDYVFAGVRYASGENKEKNVPNCTATVFNISGNYYNISSLDSQIHLAQLPKGVYFYQVEVRDKNGNYIQLLPNGRIYFNVGGATWPTDYFDLNARLDGTYVGNLSGFGTADVYINGKLAANDVTDYYTSHRYGTTFEIKDIKAKTGYTYNGVYSGSLSGMIGDSWFKNYVELNFTKNSYQLTVNSNNTGYGTVSGSGSYKHGSTVTIEATPKAGYSFSKWDDGNTNPSRTVTVTGNKTYTATFTANKYTVTLDNQSPTTEGTKSVSATFGSAMPAITKPQKTGYTFGGYYTEKNGAGTQYYNSNGASVKSWDKTAAATLYAKWNGNKYTVTLDNQSPTLYGTTSVSATFGSAMPAMTKPQKTGYTFGGYYTEKNGAGTQYYNSSGASVKAWDKTAAATLYAKWTANQYTVTLDNQSPTTEGTKSVSATFGSQMPDITIPQKTGYSFKGYFTEKNGAGTQYYNIYGESLRAWNKTEATTLYAHWAINSYKLNVYPQGGMWEGSTSDKSFNINYNATKTITDPAKTGYTFTGWAFNGAGTIAPWGKSTLKTSPFFSDGAVLSVYNNKGNGSVTANNVKKSSDCPTPSTSPNMIQITTSGTATPGLGGFYQSTNSKKSGVFYHIILAKIPEGYYIQAAWNTCGGGSDEEHSWVTSRAGTGKWEPYICKTVCSSSGTNYSTHGFVFLTKDPNVVWKVNQKDETASTPVTWYVAYANVLDASNISTTNKVFTAGAGVSHLVALWKSNTYSVKYNGNGATSGSMSNSTHIYDKEKALTKNAFSRTGYEFMGWSADNSSTAVAQYTNNEVVKNLSATNGATVNLYAVWHKIPETSGVEFSERSYYGGKELTLLSGTSGAKIYYTTDGTTPTTSSKLYSSPLRFETEGNVTVKALAYKENYITSAVSSYSVSVGKTNAVIFTDENTMIGKNVKLTVSGGNARIYYTLDGATPTTASSLYSEKLSFNEAGTKTVKAYAVASGCIPCEVFSHSIIVAAAAQPQVSVTEEWVGGAMVKITSSTAGASVYYTVDGTDPFVSSTAKLYTEEFEIDKSMSGPDINTVLIRAAAKKSGYAISPQTNHLVQLKDRELFAPYLLDVENIIGGKKVSIACETEGADIYYILDGAETTRMLYTGPIELIENTTVRAISTYNNETSEELVIPIEIPKMQPPLINVINGDNASTVQITGQTTNSTIYYTTNGDYPTTQSEQYSLPFEIAETSTIRAIAVRKGYINSDIAEADAIVITITPPKVATLGAENITETTAVLHGEMLSGGDQSASDMSFIYYERNNRSAVYSAAADSSFKAKLVNLKPNTEYCFQAIVANSKGFANGIIKSFRTSTVPTENPASIKISPDFVSMSVGTSRTVLATVLPENADNQMLVWKSSDERIATVDNNGCITAVSAGSATITATAPGNRIKGSMKVAVINGEIRGEFDFSEIAMAKNTSSIWNQSNKGETFEIDSVLVGGNAVMASAYLARWGGAVLEEKDPYPHGIGELNTNQYTSDYHVQEILYLPSRLHSLDNDEIKKAVMEYGAVYAQFKLDQNYFTTDLKNYYLPPSKASKATGHAIAIVGWDDNYSKVKFKRNNRPEANGAFICKNSWGTHDSSGYEVGEDGYFYISYYDPYIANYGVNAVFCNAENNSNYNTIYQYDPLGPVVGKEYNDQIYMANVFPRRGEALAQDESLKAVSFYTADKGIAYEIYIIPEFTNDNFFDSLGVCRASGVMEYAGYHTVKLDEEIDLKAGNRFAVIVKLSSGDGKVATYLEAPVEEMAAQNATAGEGESFMSVDGIEWNDIHLEGIPGTFEKLPNTNVCIKAFTNRKGNAVSLMSAIDNRKTSNETISVYDAIDMGFDVNEEFIEDLEKVSLFENEEAESEFGAGASAPSIVVGNNGIDNAEGARFPKKYDLRKEGNALSTVKDQGSFNTCWAFAAYASLESCIMKKAQSVRYYDNMAGSSPEVTISFAALTTPVTAVEFSKQTMKIAKGNSELLYVTITPSNATDKSVVWESSNPECVRVDTSGNITAVELGNATITAINQSSGLSASCVVTVTEPAPVADITSKTTEIVCSEGDAFMVDYEIAPENAGNKSVIIAADNDMITVSGGLITAIRSGKTTITVTTVDGGRSIAVPLTILPAKMHDTTEEVIIEYAEITDTGIVADIVNENNNDVVGEILIATYDKKTGQMIDVISDEVTVPACDILFYSADVGISTDHAVKILIWKRTNTKPLCEAYELAR